MFELMKDYIQTSNNWNLVNNDQKSYKQLLFKTFERLKILISLFCAH